MTEPEPPPLPLGWPNNTLVWCVVCGVHYGTAIEPKCAVRLDEIARVTR